MLLPANGNVLLGPLCTHPEILVFGANVFEIMFNTLQERVKKASFPPAANREFNSLIKIAEKLPPILPWAEPALKEKQLLNLNSLTKRQLVYCKTETSFMDTPPAHKHVCSCSSSYKQWMLKHLKSRPLLNMINMLWNFQKKRNGYIKNKCRDFHFAFSGRIRCFLGFDTASLGQLANLHSTRNFKFSIYEDHGCFWPLRAK